MPESGRATLVGRLLALAGTEQCKFLLAGAYNTVFGYLAFAGLYLLLGRYAHYLAIAALSHFLSVCNSFFSYRRFVFRARGPWPAQFIKFNINSLMALVAGMALLSLIVEGFDAHPLLAQACAMTLTVVLSYALHKGITFSDAGSPR